MTDRIPIDEKPNLMEKANDYLLDAVDFLAVLKTFLKCDSDEFDRSNGQVVCREIARLIEAARAIVVDS